MDGKKTENNIEKKEESKRGGEKRREWFLRTQMQTELSLKGAVVVTEEIMKQYETRVSLG